MATDRHAEVTWNGSLLEGSGRIDRVTSGALDGRPLTWRARAEDDPTGTSPEDLIAAIRAHKPGDTMKITYVRNGQTTTVEVTLAERPSQ